MRKLLILCFFLPLIVWGQMVSPLEEGEFFGFSPNVEVEASFKDGFLVFRKFQPLDKVSRVGLKLRCHSGGISSENRLRVLSNGNFAGICEVIHGQSVGTMIDAANNTNLDARGVFPHLRINSQHSLAGELSVTLIPASWRTQVDQLRRQGSLSSTYAFFNSGKAHPFSDGGVSSPVSEARGEPDGGLNRPGSGAGEDREKRQDLERVVALFKSAPSDLGWKSHLDRVIQSELRQWFSPVLVLDEVPTPTYPAALSLKQESWETNKEFEDRVEKARTERRQTIDRLQAEYKSNVDERNRRVAELNKQQQERQARLPQKRRELIQLGISILNPAVSLVDPALDQQSGALTVAAQVDGLGRQTFAFKDTLQAFRKSVLTEPKSMKAKPEFQVSDAGEITLQGITVEAGGISARGFPSAGITPSVQLATVNLPQSTAPALVQQSAITVDRNQVEQILYREENDLLRKRLEDQRKQQEQALANAEAKAAAEIARIRAEAEALKKQQPVPVLNYAAVQDAHALVIGNSAYPGSNRLANPTNDAKAMTAKLRSLGFKVTEISNATREQMVRGLSEFSKTASRTDLTLLFYAGHGVQIAGTNYMIPIDMSLNDATQATLQAVSLNSVVEQYLPGKTKLVFLDACRDNPLMASVGRGVTKGLAPINVSQGTLIAYATKDGQTADDGVGSKNSPFTSALLDHLADPDDIAVVLRTVRAKVMERTNNRQQPWEYGSLTGGALVLSAIKR